MTALCCLIVDDHEQLRNLLSDWLEAIFPTVQFISAASGETALELVHRHQPDVVVMDIGLPGMSGIEATRRIKQAFPATFVVIHTIHDEDPSAPMRLKPAPMLLSSRTAPSPTWYRF